MRNTLTDGEREILAELERDAREEREGERCDRCNGSGLEKLDPRTFDPIPCPCCGGSGIDQEGGQL
jgi:DnaJ-class molecular chaperone